jgi:hypothetical protein
MRHVLRSGLPKKARSDILKLCDLIANAINTVTIISRSYDTIGLNLVRALLAVWRTQKRTGEILVSQKQAPVGLTTEDAWKEREDLPGDAYMRHMCGILSPYSQKLNYWYHLSKSLKYMVPGRCRRGGIGSDRNHTGTVWVISV